MEKIISAGIGCIGTILVAWFGGLFFVALATSMGDAEGASDVLKLALLLFPSPEQQFFSFFKTVIWGIIGALGGYGVSLKF